MKRIFNSGMAFLALFTLTLTASCSDDDSNSTGSVLPSGTYISASIDGQAFETLSIGGQSTAVATKTNAGDQSLIMISASAQNTNTMVITLLGVNGTGTYQLNADSDNNVSFVDFATNISYNSSADCEGARGTINVTHFDDQKIEGTFEFVGKNDENCANSKTVTSGSFRGVYQAL